MCPLVKFDRYLRDREWLQRTQIGGLCCIPEPPIPPLRLRTHLGAHPADPHTRLISQLLNAGDVECPGPQRQEYLSPSVSQQLAARSSVSTDGAAGLCSKQREEMYVDGRIECVGAGAIRRIPLDARRRARWVCVVADWFGTGRSGNLGGFHSRRTCVGEKSRKHRRPLTPALASGAAPAKMS